jgi:hypothetical protein
MSDMSEPPQLDERQAAIMKAQGYSWDGKRWFRGDPASRDRRAAECRSSTRVARFIDRQDGETVAQCGSAVRKATQRLEKVMQEARDEALSVDERSRAINIRIKDRLASKWAPYAWTAFQLALGLGLALASSTAQWGAAAALGEAPWAVETLLDAVETGDAVGGVLTAAGIGLAFAPVATVARRQLRGCHSAKGLEGSVGQLERILADSAAGSHALPAPWEWRCGGDTAWPYLALLFEVCAPPARAGWSR